MMWTQKIRPSAVQVLVPVRIVGPLGRRHQINMVLDTGTPVTIVTTSLAEALDLTAHRSIGISRLMGPLGPEDGYRVPATRIEVLGRTLEGFVIHCHDLEPRLKVRGVLGLDVLRQGDLHLNLPEGLVEFQWADR